MKNRDMKPPLEKLRSQTTIDVPDSNTIRQLKRQLGDAIRELDKMEKSRRENQD